MKSLLLLSLLPLLLLPARPVRGQAAGATGGGGTAAPAPAAVPPLPPPDRALPPLFEAARRHSGEVTGREAAQGLAAEDLKLARKRILNTLAVTSGYTYGSLPYFATADASRQPVYLANPFSQGARGIYTVGANVVLPLDALAGRRSTLRRQEWVVKQADGERATAEQKLQAEVIGLYQDLALARTGVQNAQQALQSAALSKTLADKRFSEGDIDISAQLLAIDFYNRAVLADAEARNRYQTATLLLENLVGASLTSILPATP